MRYLAVILISLLSSGAAVAGPAKDLRDARYMFEWYQPVSVDIKNGTLTVVLRDRVVDQKVFAAAIVNLCMGTLNKRTMPSVKKIEILNSMKGQGHVYRRGLDNCPRIMELSESSNARGLEVAYATIFADSHGY